MKHLTKNVLHRILMRVHIRKDNAFERILEPGIYHFLDPKNRLLVSLLDERHTMWNHANLREVVKAGALEGRALLLDLKEDERAIVTVNGTIHAVLDTGQYVFPNTFNDVSAEVLTVTGVRFEHPKMTALLNVPGTATLFMWVARTS